MRVQVRVASPGTAKRIAQRRLADESRHVMEDMGREMVKIANQKMAQLFDLNRPSTRRRHPGTVRAKNALDYQVDGSGPGGFGVLRYRVRGGDDVVGRIIFMNWGTGEHEISPSGAWEGRGLTPFPPRARPRGGTKLGWFDGEWTVINGSVIHPGQRATHFLEEAAEEAVAKIARRSL